MPTVDTDWPYDADQHDPLTKLRIPVTSAHPQWRYVATFDRHSGQRPTDAEAAQLGSFIQQYIAFFFNDWYKGKLRKLPLDVDSGCVTKTFHKWADGGWSYRVSTWECGPFWVPEGPSRRAQTTDPLGPLSLAEVMDRVHTFGTHGPTAAWASWKAEHPDVFPAVKDSA